MCSAGDSTELLHKLSPAPSAVHHNCKHPASSSTGACLAHKHLQNHIKNLSQKCSLPQVAGSWFPVLFCPFYLSGVSQQWLELLTWALLSWGLFCSQGCERFAEPGQVLRSDLAVLFIFQQLPRCFLEVAATPLKTSIPRICFWNRLSPLQIQLYSFSWVIFSPCCIFGSLGVFLTEFIKN